MSSSVVRRTRLVIGESLFFQILIVTTLGVLVGLIMVLDIPMWLRTVFALMLAAVTVIPLVKDLKRVLLFVIVFAIPFYVGKDFLDFLTFPQVFLDTEGQHIFAPHLGLVDYVGIHAVDVLTVALLYVLLARIATGRKRSWCWYPLPTILGLLWIVGSAFSITQSIDPGLSLIQIIAMVRLFIMYLVIANAIEDETDLMWLCAGLFTGVVAQSLLGILQGITGHPLGLYVLGEASSVRVQGLAGVSEARPQGTMGNPNPYAMYLMSGVAFAMAGLVSRIRSKYRAGFAVTLVVIVIALAYSLSRASWINLLIVGITGVIIILRRKLIRLRYLLIVMVVGLFILAIVGDKVLSRLESSDQGSAISRVWQLEGAMRMFFDYPIVGGGLNNYAFYMPQYDKIDFQIIKGPLMIYNIYALIAVETGIVGLSTFILFLITNVFMAGYALIRARNEVVLFMSLGVLISLTTLAVHGLVDYALLSNIQVFRQFWLLIALASSTGYIASSEVKLSIETIKP